MAKNADSALRLGGRAAWLLWRRVDQELPVFE